MSNFFRKIFTYINILCLGLSSVCCANAAYSYENNTVNCIPSSYNVSSEEMIQDFLVDSTLDKSVKIEKTVNSVITDDLIDSDFENKYSDYPIISYSASVYDDFALRNLADYSKVCYEKKIYDFENINHLKIKIKTKDYLSTKFLKEEGESVDFLVAEDVIADGKVIIPKNAVIKARVETISPNMSRGIPADLIIGHFKYKKFNLDGEISKTGANRLYWVLPAAMVANTLFIGSGYILWAIRGGHAKVKPKQIFEIYLPEDIKTSLIGITTINK